MKLCLCLVLLGTLALSSARPWVSEGRCIDITHSVPCQDKPDGDFHICNFCEHGYFVTCQENELTNIQACPTAENENGQIRRLIFDDVIKTCVKENPSCTRRIE